MTKNFTQNPGESAREFALRFLLDQIINLEFAPGQKISDIEISKELNISRTPVREAILSLTNGHLIESYPQKGIFISLIDCNIVEQVCTMGRSMTREVKMAFSDAFPSLLLKPPGIFPTAYNFSSYSTLRGKKSIPSLGLSEAVAVANTTVSP